MRSFLLTIFAIAMPLSAQVSTPFTATQFLEAVTPDRPRPTDWPKRLTFTDMNLAKEQALRLLQSGPWRTSYSCGGEPIKLIQFAEREFEAWGDGFNWPLVHISYDIDGTIRRDVSKWIEKRSNHQGSDVEDTYDIQPIGDGIFELHTTENGYQWKFRVVSINENGELALYIYDYFKGSSICKNMIFLQTKDEAAALM